MGKAWIPPSQRRVYSFVFTFIIFFFTPHYKLTRREKLQFLGSEVRKDKKKKHFPTTSMAAFSAGREMVKGGEVTRASVG